MLRPGRWGPRSEPESSLVLRRIASRVLLASVLAVGLLVVRPESIHGDSLPAPEPYRLRFHHTHTGERLDVVYRHAVSYEPGALARIDRLLRDWRKDDAPPCRPRPLELLPD